MVRGTRSGKQGIRERLDKSSGQVDANASIIRTNAMVLTKTMRGRE